MRALRVVGLTEDGEVVLEDPVRLERYTVPADERLRAAARGDLSRLGQIAIELESQLRPREIQARIRAGASVEQVATAAGVPEQKIERFAYPVLLERSRTADNAQRAHPMRADGPDNRTLGDVVAHTFGLRGQEYEGVKWDSWKGEDGQWVVALTWRAGRSDNRAHWAFQPGAHGGTVTALDEHASDLVEGLPARPLRTVGAVVDMTRPEEEPPPAPSPVEQWRAAASDSFREQRLPTAPDRRTADAERAVAARAVAAPGRAAGRAPPRAAGALPAGGAPRGPAPGCLPPQRTPRRPASGPSGLLPADRGAPDRLPTGRHPPRGSAAGSPTPGAARQRRPGDRGVGSVGARRHPDRDAARAPCASHISARWRRGGARGADRGAGGAQAPTPTPAPGGPGSDVATPPLASPVIPAPTAEQDPVVEPATEPAADVTEAPAETPAGGRRRAHAGAAGGGRRGRGAGHGGCDTGRPEASRRPPSRPQHRRRTRQPTSSRRRPNHMDPNHP